MKALSRAVALVAYTFLLCAGSSDLALSQEPAVAESPAQPDPVSFPRRVASQEGVVVIHTPQIDTWKDFASVEARVAVEVTPAGEGEPVYGVSAFTAYSEPAPLLRVGDV